MKIKVSIIVGSIFLLFCSCIGNKPKKSAQTSRIGIQSWTFRLFTLQETIAKADSAGIAYIEAFWGQPLGGGLTDSFGSSMSVDSRAMLKSWLKSKEISLSAMGVIGPRNEEGWIKAFELAREFDMKYITSEPGKDQWNMIDSLAGIYEVKVAIHDHPIPSPYWHPDSVLLAIANRENLGACADVGHWVRSGLDPVDCLKKLDGRVLGVHLKDVKTFGDRFGEDTVVSLGVIDFPAIFKELRRQNFKGMLSIEHESNWTNSLPDILYTVEYLKKNRLN